MIHSHTQPPALALLALLLFGCGSTDEPGYRIDEPILAEEGLRINEVLPWNNFINVDPDDVSENGPYDDWIELYNASSDPIDLDGYYLSDSEANRLKEPLPAGTVIEPGDTLLLWADGLEEVGEGPLHLGFGLSGGGETLYLSHLEGEVGGSGTLEIVTDDIVNYQDPFIGLAPDGAVLRDYSVARHPDGTGPLAPCGFPTPDAPNGLVCESHYAPSE